MLTLSREQAFHLDAIHGTTEEGENFEMMVVDTDIIEEDVYVDGRYDGKRRLYTAEGHVGDDETTYIFDISAESPGGSEEAFVSIAKWLGEDEWEDFNIEEAEIEVNRNL